MDCVKDIFLFEGLTDVERSEICNLLSPPVIFGKGEKICDYDSKGALAVILSGRAVARSGKLEKRSFSRGDVFGVASMFCGGEQYFAQIVALCETCVLFFEEALLKRIFAAYPKTAENYITFLSSRIRFLNQKLDCLGGNDAKEKVYRYLEVTASSSGEVYVRDMSSLAKGLGLGRTSLYRALSELELENRVKKDKNIIKVY